MGVCVCGCGLQTTGKQRFAKRQRCRYRYNVKQRDKGLLTPVKHNVCAGKGCNTLIPVYKELPNTAKTKCCPSCRKATTSHRKNTKPQAPAESAASRNRLQTCFRGNVRCAKYDAGWLSSSADCKCTGFVAEKQSVSINYTSSLAGIARCPAQ